MKTLIILITTIFLSSFSASNLYSQENSDQKTYDKVEVKPEYPGGMKALGQFFSENIKYPEAAKKKGISGKVYISFVIDKKGNITKAELKKGIGHGCDEEALRIVNLMPNWAPGKNKGKAVKVSMVLPVEFKLD